MALKDFQSLCSLHQKIIVSRDQHNPQKHVANNNDLCKVYQYRVDGIIITDGKSCDYLLWNDVKNNIYLIELKGSDLEYAVEQLEQTELVLKQRYWQEIKDAIFYYRVVLNKVTTHALASNKVKKFMNRHNGQCCFETKILEEAI